MVHPHDPSTKKVAKISEAVILMVEISLAYLEPGDMDLLARGVGNLDWYEYQYGVHVLTPHEPTDATWAALRLQGFSKTFVDSLRACAEYYDSPENSQDRRNSRWIKYDVDAPLIEGLEKANG